MSNNLLRFSPGNRLRFVYTNWKGEVAIRTCLFEFLSVGITEHHADKVRWFLNGIDLDKNERRTYALDGIEPSSLEAF